MILSLSSYQMKFPELLEFNVWMFTKCNVQRWVSPILNFSTTGNREADKEALLNFPGVKKVRGKTLHILLTRRCLYLGAIFSRFRKKT